MLSKRSFSHVRRPALATLVALAALAGCSSEGYSVGRDRTPEQRRAAFPIDSAEWTKLGYRLDWTGFPAITGELPIQYILPGQDIVITLEGGTQISILEATTGRRRAADQLANPLTRFVGIGRDGERIYAFSEAEVFTIDPQTCILRNRNKTEKIVSSEPVQYGNLLVFGTLAGEVIAHMATGSVGGVKVWGFAAGGSVARKPTLIGSVVGAVSQSGQVVFLDAETGGLVGRNVIYAGLETDPVSDQHAMYIASLDQSVYAFAPLGGSMLWRYRTNSPLRTQPTVHAGRLYCSIPGQGLVAFDAASGEVLWQCKDFANGVVVGTNRNRLVVFNGAEGALIDPEHGDLLERSRLNGVAMLKSDTFIDGNLYAVSKSGIVAKFQRR